MREHDNARIRVTQFGDVGRRKALMHFAVAFPGDDLHMRLGGDVVGQIFVGKHDHAIGAEGLDDGPGITGRAANIGFRLHGGGCVDIGDDGDAAITLAQQAHVGRRDRIGQRATGLEIWKQDRLFRVQQFGGLRHELHTGENDRLCLGLGRFAGERQAVADDVGDAMEDFGRLIIVRENDGVASALQIENGGNVSLGERRLARGRRERSMNARLAFVEVSASIGRTRCLARVWRCCLGREQAVELRSSVKPDLS